MGSWRLQAGFDTGSFLVSLTHDATSLIGCSPLWALQNATPILGERGEESAAESGQLGRENENTEIKL